MSVRAAVLGAGGTIAPAIVRDLAESPEVGELLLLDLEPGRATKVARDHGGGKCRVLGADARRPGELAERLRDVEVLVNTASYRINLGAMDACLMAGCHYLDLGGLYRVTLQQLERGAAFATAGLLGLLGMGSSPGKTNLMAAWAVEELGAEGERPTTIDVFAAGRDPVSAAPGVLRPPYALQTLVDEVTLAPVVLRDGRPEEIAPLSDGGRMDFGEPIGPGDTIYTLHSELASFGESFGARGASFRLSLSQPLLAALRELAGADEVTVARAALGAAPASAQTVSVHIVRVTAEGGRTVTARAVARPHFGLGGSIVSTAAPAAAAVRLLVRGAISARGVLPPERAVDHRELFAELAARGCTFTLEESG